MYLGLMNCVIKELPL